MRTFGEFTMQDGQLTGSTIEPGLTGRFTIIAADGCAIGWPPNDAPFQAVGTMNPDPPIDCSETDRARAWDESIGFREPEPAALREVWIHPSGIPIQDAIADNAARVFSKRPPDGYVPNEWVHFLEVRDVDHVPTVTQTMMQYRIDTLQHELNSSNRHVEELRARILARPPLLDMMANLVRRYAPKDHGDAPELLAEYDARSTRAVADPPPAIAVEFRCPACSSTIRHKGGPQASIDIVERAPPPADGFAAFEAYVVRNIPPDTIITDPLWWALRLWRAAHPTAPAADPDGVWCACSSCCQVIRLPRYAVPGRCSCSRQSFTVRPLRLTKGMRIVRANDAEPGV